MRLTGQTILIVDDNIDDRFFIGRAVKRIASGLSVQFVSSGEEATAYLDGSGAYADRLHFPYPSFVITDLNMPHGDGFSVLRHIQAGAHAFVRVMMLSSSDDPEHRRRASGLGASSYCTKPQDPSALESLVSRFIDPVPEASAGTLIPIRPGEGLPAANAPSRLEGI